jgi:hypothetical protein
MQRFRVFVLVAAILAVFSGTGRARVPNAVTYWNDVAATAGITGRPGPSAIFDLAVVQLAVHDAVQALEGRFEPYLYSDPSAHGSSIAAVAGAAFGVLKRLYPAQLPNPPSPPGATGLQAKFDAFVAANGIAGDPALDFGDDAAEALMTQYKPIIATPTNNGGTGIGEWRPAPPLLLSGQNEYFGLLLPFTLLTTSQFTPEGPPPISSQRYVREYDEVKALGRATGSTRTQAQTDHAFFWADNFGVQWNRAVRAIIDDLSLDIGDSARLLALVNTAEADAVMTAFQGKYDFNFWRPVTAIREGANDGNPRTTGDAAWLPLIGTPAYPDYPSGANNVTGSTVGILQHFFGTDEFEFVVTSNVAQVQPNKNTRVFTRFSDAAQEVVEARILQGIHFRSADADARDQGMRVAHWVFQKFLRPTHGK